MREMSNRSSISLVMCSDCRSMTACISVDSESCDAVLPQDLHGADDVGQRIAQFVRQHGQELVLAAIGFHQIVVGRSFAIEQPLPFPPSFARSRRLRSPRVGRDVASADIERLRRERVSS